MYDEENFQSKQGGSTSVLRKCVAMCSLWEDDIT